MKLSTIFKALIKSKNDMEIYSHQRVQGIVGIAVSDDYWAKLWRRARRQSETFEKRISNHIESVEVKGVLEDLK